MKHTAFCFPSLLMAQVTHNPLNPGSIPALKNNYETHRFFYPSLLMAR